MSVFALNLQSDTDMPVLLRVYAKPTKSYTKCNDRKHDQDVRAPGTKIRKGTQDQEDNYLNREGQAIAKQDDGVDGACPAHEVQGFCVACGLVHEILESSRTEVEEREPIVADVVAAIVLD